MPRRNCEFLYWAQPLVRAKAPTEGSYVMVGGQTRTWGIAQYQRSTVRRGIAIASHQAAKPSRGRTTFETLYALMSALLVSSFVERR